MMKDLLSNIFVKSYKSSSVIKDGWEKEDLGIVRTISLDKSSFGAGSKKLFVAVSLDFKSNYCSDLDFYNHICDASINNGSMCSRENMRSVDHWGDDDEEAIKEALENIAIPWVDNIGKPEVFIDFLERAKNVGMDGMDAEHAAVFGDVIAALQCHPPRLRKLYNGYLASIYERIGEKKKAFECLTEYKSFYEKDKAAEPDAKSIVLKQIEEGLARLNL